MKQKNLSAGRKKETKKFLLLCERIVYCFAQRLIVQQQHDSKRSLHYKTIPVVLNEANSNLGNETRLGLIVKLLFSHFIPRIDIGFGIGKNVGNWYIPTLNPI